MKSKAAILWETHSKWSVEDIDIDLDPPRQGEVLIKLAASGPCHSDEHLVTGDMVLDQATADALGLKQLPVIGGHEGAERSWRSAPASRRSPPATTSS